MAAPEAANQKLFSIIMATYNCGQKVENTLQSIFSQNKELFELIVLDGASTDDTLDYIKNYESDLTLISEKDDGVYYAFNKGIDLATGKYIYFIGAGDCLKPNILEQVKDFLPPENPGFVYGNCYFVKNKVYNGKEFTSTLFIRDNLCQQGIFYHRTIFDMVGKYDLRYRIFADWFFNLKCFMHDGVTKRYIDYVIADYEEGGISAEINRDPIFVKEFPLFVKKHFGIYNYFLCKAFLKEPYIFNFIYFRKYSLLFWHLIYNYSFPKYLATFAKSYIPGYKYLKEAIRNKN
ncbi:MAG: glycosyltransferase [Acidobacteriota bacterium]|nr:glycosyltransferase [Acidobacteriota bacterium]